MKQLLYFILLIVILLSACTERLVNTTGNVYGSVRDATTGAPLNNCSVLLTPLGLSTTTGDSGSFYFANIEGGEYTIQASRSGYITNSTHLTVTPNNDNRVDLLLTNEASTKGRIRGSVIDANTQTPLSGCSVILSPGNQSKVTDEWGAFLFDNLSPGTYSLRITKDEYLDQAKYDIVVRADTETPVQILLYDESSTKGTITGTVCDYETNDVLEGCLVTLQPGGASQLTDSDGCFLFEELIPAEYGIIVSKKNYSPSTKNVTVDSGQNLFVKILLSKESMTKGGITGTVRDYETNDVLEGCLITLQPAGTSQLTDSKGHFSFEELAPADYEIIVSKKNYTTYAKKVTIEPGKNLAIEILLSKDSMTQGSIFGTIRDKETNNILEGCLVTLQPSGASQLTDSDGCFLFENLAPSEYEISISKKDYASTTKQVTVEPGKNLSVEILLSKESMTKGEITGTVRDFETNDVLEGCLVTLQPGGASQLTDSDGCFLFENLAPSEYEITISKKDYTSYTKQVTVDSGKNLSVEILLSKDSMTQGSISGTIRDKETNNILEGCLVTLQPGGASQLTDSDGCFLFENLAPSEYEISISKKDYASTTKQVTVEPGKNLSVEILLSKESMTKGGITGTVRDYDTNDILEGCLVTLQPSGASQLTDSDGCFLFEDLAPNEYEISISKKDYTSYTKQVTVEPGKNLSVEILLSKESSTKGEIAGTVIETDSRLPIAFCTVTLVETGARTETNDSGEFRFKNLTPGTYSLQIRKDNYLDQSKSGIVVRAKEITSVEVLMQEILNEEQPPVLGSVSVSNVSSNSSRLSCSLLDEGSNTITEYGFLISKTPSPQNDYGVVRIHATRNGDTNFYGVATSLTASTLYYACAYVTTSAGKTYSDVTSFRTLSQGDSSVPSNIICVALSGNDSNDGKSWTNAKRSINSAISCATQGQQIWVSVGYFSEIITPNDGISIYGGFNGSERTVEERQPGSRTSINGISCNIYTQETIVDGFEVSDKSYVVSNSYAVILKDYVYLRNCEISKNKYGIIYISCREKSCVIDNCVISGNTLKGGSDGAIQIASSGAVTIVNSYIQGNNGHAIFNDGYVKTINCVITNNKYGVRVAGAGGQFINTTFASNGSYAVGAESATQLYNCLVWNNKIIANLYGTSYGTVIQEYCKYVPDADNSEVRFVGPVTYGSDWTKANWALSSGSVCIDSGTNIFYAIDEDPYDITGRPRISNGIIDIGAYEYQY